MGLTTISPLDLWSSTHKASKNPHQQGPPSCRFFFGFVRGALLIQGDIVVSPIKKYFYKCMQVYICAVNNIGSEWPAMLRYPTQVPCKQASTRSWRRPRTRSQWALGAIILDGGCVYFCPTQAPPMAKSCKNCHGNTLDTGGPWQFLRDFAMGGAWVRQKYTQPPSRTILRLISINVQLIFLFTAMKAQCLCWPTGLCAAKLRDKDEEMEARKVWYEQTSRYLEWHAALCCTNLPQRAATPLERVMLIFRVGINA